MSSSFRISTPSIPGVDSCCVHSEFRCAVVLSSSWLIVTQLRLHQGSTGIPIRQRSWGLIRLLLSSLRRDTNCQKTSRHSRHYNQPAPARLLSLCSCVVAGDLRAKAIQEALKVHRKRTDFLFTYILTSSKKAIAGNQIGAHTQGNLFGTGTTVGKRPALACLHPDSLPNREY